MHISHKKHISVTKVLEQIPGSILDSYATVTSVDHGTKKLTGKIILVLFLYGFLSSGRISQRILASVYNSARFKSIFSAKSTIGYSALSMRLATVKTQYFENIFNYLSQTYQDTLIGGRSKIPIRKLDSTFITISSKLIEQGMIMNEGTKNLKFGVMIEDSLPIDIQLFTTPSEISDNVTFMSHLREQSINPLTITIFDRGLQKVSHFDALVQENIYFISRLRDNAKVTLKTTDTPMTCTETLERITDSKGMMGSCEQFRIITATKKGDNTTIRFITNVDFLSAAEVTELYRQRWEIETFFKFIKQELSFGHLISRNENGIKAVMYVTMIAAILLTLYKKANKLTNWVIIKLKFLEELETAVIHTWSAELSPVFKRLKSNNYPYKHASG